MVKAADVDWGEYFLSIQTQCPWSLTSWTKGLIEIKTWHGDLEELGEYRARVYVVKGHNKRRLKKLCDKLDHGEYEWLWSYPGYGPYATPVACLIQQRRSDLAYLRTKLK